MSAQKRTTHWILIAIALAFAVVALFGVLTWQNIVNIRQSEALVAKSYAVREATRELLSSVKDMETGQRGFLLTSDPAYLEPYHSGVDDMNEEFERLQKLTRDDESRQSVLQTFANWSTRNNPS